MSKMIKLFGQYLREQVEHQEGMDRPLKGYKAEQVIARITELMKYLPDNVRFGVPSDTLGRATSYRDANGAIQKIKDMQHYYESKNEEVRFYCWSISYKGTWSATQSLRQKIEAAGGFGESDLNVNLKKIIEYLESNPEDSDNFGSFSISMDAMSIRKSSGQETPPDEKEKKPKAEEKPTEDKEVGGQAAAPKEAAKPEKPAPTEGSIETGGEEEGGVV